MKENSFHAAIFLLNKIQRSLRRPDDFVQAWLIDCLLDQKSKTVTGDSHASFHCRNLEKWDELLMATDEYILSFDFPVCIFLENYYKFLIT
jgi:hypothetical protein